MKLFALLLGVTALAAAAPPPAAAQPVVGIVVEAGTGLPVSGAMVVLFDDDGAQVDRMLTNAAGRFTLDPPLPGPHYITVERIGYRNMTTPRFDPASSRELMTIEVPVEAILLRRLDVTAGRRCEMRPEEGRATAQVWERGPQGPGGPRRGHARRGSIATRCSASNAGWTATRRT